jgi:hypothetical protein
MDLTCSIPREGNVWPGLIIKTSKQDLLAGNGVFATKAIPAGLRIPIYGALLTEAQFSELETKSQDTHTFKLHNSSSDHVYIDGRPSIMPYNGVGGEGMYIAMMMNEPCRGKPNCIFKGNTVQVAKDLEAGEELTLSYGPGYRRSYSVSAYCDRKCSYPKLNNFK